MSIKQIYIARGSTINYTTGFDRYTCFEDSMSVDATEANKKQYLRVSGATFSYLSVYISANTLNVNANLKFINNGSVGNQNVVITAGVTGLFQDTSGTDTVAQDNTVSLEQVVGVATGSATPEYWSCVASPSTNWRYYGQNAGGNLSSASIFRSLSGNSTAVSGSEANAQVKFRQSGTLKKSQVTVSVNTETSSNVIVMRKNGANANLTMTVPGSTTGIFEDTANSDTVSVGDLFNWNTTSLSGTTTGTVLSVEFVSDDSAITQVAASGGNSVTAGTTTYSNIAGNAPLNTTEAIVSVPINFAYTVTKFETYVSSNATTSNSTLDFRVGSTNPAGSPLITITSGTTGYFSDLTSVYTGSSGDLVNYRYVNGGGGTLNTTFRGILMNEVQVTPPASGPAAFRRTLSQYGTGKGHRQMIGV